jgi:capsular exopolysaccharide synthesis family protein
MRTVERLNQDWLLATEIHKLEARLWRIAQQDGVKVILFTSANRGEGKSTTVAYLATALALHPDRRILAADMDFRAPQLNEHFRINGAGGLGAVLRGDRPLQGAIIKTELPSLDLLLPNPDGEDPHLLLRTQQSVTAFEALRNSYDLVLIDSPAMMPVADASILMPLADGVVLVAMAGKSTKPMLRRARETCLGMGAKILGLVVGNLQEVMPGYDGASYYYGHRREKPPERGKGEQKAL